MSENRRAAHSRQTLAIQGFRHSFPDGRRLTIPGRLRLGPGDCALITGATGSGKTTLLYAIAGLLPGLTEGVDTRDSTIGLAFQNPCTQLFFSSVEEEVSFAPRNRGLPAAEVQVRVRRCLEAVGLPGWEKRAIDDLSMGEKHRVAIASACSSDPVLLLLDEPFAQLDSRGETMLRRLLTDYLRRGGAVLVSEHDPDRMTGIADRILNLPAVALPDPCRSVPDQDHATPYIGGSRPDIDLRKLTLRDSHGGYLLRDLTWTVTGGERIHIRGPNGSGKSSLLRTLAGLVPADCVHIEVAGCQPSPAALAGSVAFLDQDPDSQLFAANVRDEVAFAADRLPVHKRPGTGWIDSLIDSLGLAQLTERSPLSLSYGEKRLVSLAAALSSRPRLVILDEPFTGLDRSRVKALYDFLADYSRVFRSTVLVTSHNPLPDRNWASRRYVMGKGRFLEDL